MYIFLTKFYFKFDSRVPGCVEVVVCNIQPLFNPNESRGLIYKRPEANELKESSDS